MRQGELLGRCGNRQITCSIFMSSRLLTFASACEAVLLTHGGLQHCVLLQNEALAANFLLENGGD